MLATHINTFYFFMLSFRSKSHIHSYLCCHIYSATKSYRNASSSQPMLLSIVLGRVKLTEELSAALGSAVRVYENMSSCTACLVIGTVLIPYGFIPSFSLSPNISLLSEGLMSLSGVKFKKGEKEMLSRSGVESDTLGVLSSSSVSS